MILVSHPHGNANVRSVLHALQAEQILEKYFTTLGLSRKAAESIPLPEKISRQLLRRAYDLPPEKISWEPFGEAIRLAALRLHWETLIRHETGCMSVDAVWRALDRRMAAAIRRHDKKIRGVYCYEDGALESFQAAREQGLICFYDQPVGYFKTARRIFSEEKEHVPAFAPTIPGLKDSETKLERKARELELADVVIAASDFVADTLREAGCPQEKIHIVQFGSPDQAPPHTGYSRQGPLRLLFVGRIGQRKGISYLLDAVARFPRSEVTLSLLGEFEGPTSVLLPYSHLFEHLPPRPHAEILKTMSRHDVFLLPSLFEGQALAVLEAMRCRLPAIVTPNSGAGTVVEEGRSGFVIPIRSSDAIAEKIEYFLKNRAAVEGMGTAALERAQSLTWASYERQIISIVQEGLMR